MTQFEPPWNPYFSPGNPLFEDLRQLFARRLGTDPPDLNILQGLLGDHCRTRTGRLVRLVDQSADLSAVEYEQQINESGEVPSRPGWHDLFNALVWSLLPRTKAALNHAHVTDFTSQVQRPRSRRRDALTLMDECGVLLASCDPRHADWHRNHDWRGLFVEHRGDWNRRIRGFVLGHGLYQQCLLPFQGLTGKALYVPVSEEFFSSPIEAQYRILDELVAQMIDQNLQSPSELLPLPVLGVPGWWAANRDPDFYLDQDYFRPRQPPLADHPL
jgi:hypothetical protein